MNDIDKLLKIKQTGIKLEAGKLLVSTPLLNDFYFGHSVILICEHEESSSLGFILNNKIIDKVSQIIPSMTGIDLPIFVGGPVNQDRAFFIHNNKLIEDSIAINDNIFWGGNIEQVQVFIKEGLIKSNEIKFFLGYAGWTANQLEREINENSWIVSNIDLENNIFDDNVKFYWKKTIQKLGKNYKIWLNFPVNPSDN